MTIKNITIIIAFLNLPTFLVAQPFLTKMSDVVDGDIGLPVLQLKDGSTIFHYDDVKNKKMIITIFDKANHIIVNRKELEFKTINYSHHFGENQQLYIEGWVDGGNNIFLYLKEKGKFYKIDLSSINGLIESEKLLSEDLPGHFNGELFKEDYDKTSDKIIVARFSSLKILNKNELETVKSFKGLSSAEIRVLSNTGEKSKTVLFDYINGKFQHAHLISELIEDGFIYLITRVFNIYDSDTYNKTLYYGRDLTGYGTYINNDCHLYLSKYDLKTNTFSHSELNDLDSKIDYTNLKILHNNSDKLSIKCTYKTNTKFGYGIVSTKLFYQTLFINVNKIDLKIDKPFNLTTNKLDKYAIDKLNLKDGYGTGMLNKSIINSKGEILVSTIKNAFDVEYGSEYVSTNKPELIGFSSFNKQGLEESAIAYPYNVDHSRYSRNNKKPNKNDFDFMIVSGSKSNMIFLNNSSKNIGLSKNKKTSYIPYTSECNGIAVEMINDEIKEHYLFGIPTNALDFKFAVFSTYLYNKINNMYIVKVYDGADYKKTRAAWITIN